MSNEEIKDAGTRHVVENAVVIDGKIALALVEAVYPEQEMPSISEIAIWTDEDIEVVLLDAAQLIFNLRDQVAFLRAKVKTLSARPAK